MTNNFSILITYQHLFLIGFEDSLFFKCMNIIQLKANKQVWMSNPFGMNAYELELFMLHSKGVVGAKRTWTMSSSPIRLFSLYYDLIIFLVLFIEFVVTFRASPISLAVCDSQWKLLVGSMLKSFILFNFYFHFK